MTLVELDARLREMKVNVDSRLIIHYNGYRLDYDTETGGINIMSIQTDEWDNYKLIEWIATVNHVKDVLKIVQ